jgi:hypothetical protein
VVKKYYFKCEKKVNSKLYKPEIINPKVYYGLDKNIKFCNNCTYSNQKPNSEKEYKHKINTKKPSLKLDSNGVCKACTIQEFKFNINWKKREDQLKRLCDKFRKNDGSYDCIVPGSGGKDSFFTSHMLQHKYGMNPLTITWAPNMYTPYGIKNMENWVNSGVDNTLFSPNRRVQRLLTRLSLENLLHPFQAFQFGQKYLAPRIAMQHGVELIF